MVQTLSVALSVATMSWISAWKSAYFSRMAFRLVSETVITWVLNALQRRKPPFTISSERPWIWRLYSSATSPRKASPLMRWLRVRAIAGFGLADELEFQEEPDGILHLFHRQGRVEVGGYLQRAALLVIETQVIEDHGVVPLAVVPVLVLSHFPGLGVAEPGEEVEKEIALHVVLGLIMLDQQVEILVFLLGQPQGRGAAHPELGYPGRDPRR